MSKGSPSVNLLKTQSAFWDQFVDWALNVGRLLVILTELVALTMFIYRFVLDRQIIDLKDKITQENTIVEILRPREVTYRNLQGRISIASAYINTQQQQTKVFKSIIESAPKDVTFNNLTVTPNKITLGVSSQSISSLKTLIASLKKNSLLDKVSIDGVENNAATAQITMTISANTKAQTENEK